MIYRAAYVLPVSAPPLERCDLLVHDGKIAGVGTDLSKQHPDEQVTDLDNCAILPGFVNTHCHLECTLKRNCCDALNLWDWFIATGLYKGAMPPYDVLLDSALLGAAECAMSGITCVADCTGTGASLEAMRRTGLRGIVYRELFGQSLGNRAESRVAEEIRTILDNQSRLPPLLRQGISPHSVYTGSGTLLRICAEAYAELNIPVSIHLAETAAEADYLLNGTGPIAELRKKAGYRPLVASMRPTAYVGKAGLLRNGVCLAHCVHLTELEIDLISQSGASVAHCPRSNSYLGTGIASIPALIRSGAVVGLGTDGAGSCGNLDFFEEMRFALAVHRAAAQDAAAMTAKMVLEMATIGGARALGLDDQIGTLEPGKRADFTAVKLDGKFPGEDIHLAVLSRGPADVMMTVVDGVEIVRDGVLRSYNVSEAASRLGIGG